MKAIQVLLQTVSGPQGVTKEMVLIALCSDGTIWKKGVVDGKKFDWEKIKAIPGSHQDAIDEIVS